MKHKIGGARFEISNYQIMMAYVSKHRKYFHQKHLSKIIDMNRFGYLLSIGSPYDVVRLNSLCNKRVGAWLLMKPFGDGNMKNKQFIAALALRLNLQIVNIGTLCNVCGAPMTATAEHSMLCTKGSADKNRHNAVRDMIVRLSRRAHLSPQIEVYGLFASQQRPADIFYPYFLGGRSKACDVTFVSPQSPSLFSKALSSTGYAMDLRFCQKEKIQIHMQHGLISTSVLIALAIPC